MSVHRRHTSSVSSPSTTPRSSYVAVQHFGPGQQVHYSLSDGDSPLRVHRSAEDRRIEAEQDEKQQLLRTLFSPASSRSFDGTMDPPPPPPAPFSPRWYPLADLLLYFLPQNYPASVTPSYLAYSKWVFIGSVFGTASGVLSMQCLLASLGLGAAAVPASAAINWVLKDGLGQLGGMLFASLVSTRFDMQPVRYRLFSAVALDASVLLEILTPLVPALFLPLAAIANIGKNISWLAASASRAAIHRSFMRRENLADLTAKCGSQTILASLVGTALGIGISVGTGAATAPILACFLALSGGHIFSMYRALRVVVVPHLTEHRVDILANRYLQLVDTTTATTVSSIARDLPSPVDLQRLEPMLLPVRVSGRVSSRRSSYDQMSATPSLTPAWSASSVDLRPRFERVIASLAHRPDLHFSPEELRQVLGSAWKSGDVVPSVAHSALYHAWLQHFDKLPFVAALEVSDDPNIVSGWNGTTPIATRVRLACSRLLVRVRARLAGRSVVDALEAYEKENEPLAASSSADDTNTTTSAHSVTPHLRIRVLLKSSASRTDVLRVSLYIAAVRRAWRDEKAPRDDDASSRLQVAHAHALELVRTDSTTTAASRMHAVNEDDDAAASSSSEHASSAFITTLRARGFAIENHFVQDDNPTRIALCHEEEEGQEEIESGEDKAAAPAAATR